MRSDNIINILLKNIKNPLLKKFFRALQAAYFFAGLTLGEAVFGLGRLIGVIPKIAPLDPGAIKKILLVRTDRIGDLIESLPAVTALRRRFPQSRIAFLATSYTSDILLDVAEINEVLVFDQNYSPSRKQAFFKSLRAEKFDLAISLAPYFKGALLAFKSGARWRIGYPDRAAGFLLTHKADSVDLLKHETESVLALTRIAGVDSLEPRAVISVNQKASSFALDFMRDSALTPADIKICIHPGGSQPHTRWPAARYAQTASALMEKYSAKVIFAAGPLDQAVLKEILSLMLKKPLVAPAGMRLRELAALIKNCDIFLGNNSGPMHIAAAVGTPVVAIFGPIHPLEHERKWMPKGDGHIVVRKAMDCRDCHPGHCRDLKCRDLVSVEDVLGAMATQIKRLKR